jgi:serine/threonine protein kinase
VDFSCEGWLVSNSDDTQIQGEDEQEGARRLSLEGSQPPALIEGFSIIRRLGTGAYGTVWLAREDRTGRMVAIKYYPHRRGLNWSLLSREVEKLATLYASRNIVRLLDVGWNAEPPYYVMEFVENGSLSAYMAGGKLSVDEVIRIVRQICGALIEAHGAGVLHCDLKPDNVLLDAQFDVRLCDFGQSRMSHEQSPALGTLYYMAPEQADLESIPDARWDVYAVGALFYHMLTGQPPYRTVEIQEKLESAESLKARLEIYQTQIRQSPAPAEHRSVRGVDARLASLIDSCLAIDPAQRLPNAQAILAVLDARERHLARRPLLVLGVLGPIMLMAAMVPIFVNALQSNLNTMEKRLTERALESDALSASIQARSLQEELDDRLYELDNIVTNPDNISMLEQLMQQSSDEVVAQMKSLHDSAEADQPQWMSQLNRLRQRSDDANRRRSRIPDTSWFLTDARGRQIWRHPYSAETLGRNYSWRDYFHGTDVQYSPDQVPEGITPLQSPHVSLAFNSEATQQYMVALSVPVRNSKGEVIGVFARTAHLGDLQSRLGKQIEGQENDTVNRVIALVDRRTWRLLDHPWLTAEMLQAHGSSEENLFAGLQLDDDITNAIKSRLEANDSQQEDAPDNEKRGLTDPLRQSVRLPRYRDPVGRLDDPSTRPYRGNWMAALVPMESEQTTWLVIVQENRDEALRPVRDMAAQASKQAVLAVISSLAIMAGVWMFVWRAIAGERVASPTRQMTDDSKSSR